MIDRETWIILGERLEQIKRAREEAERPEPKVKLVFDAYDQARVVPVVE